MGASFTVLLDVTPPAVAWGVPSRRSDLRARVPYAVTSDAAVVDAEIDAQAATIGPLALFSAQPFPSAVLLDVAATIRDDVGNETLSSVILQLPAPVPLRPRSRVVPRRRFGLVGSRLGHVSEGRPGKVS